MICEVTIKYSVFGVMPESHYQRQRGEGRLASARFACDSEGCEHPGHSAESKPDSKCRFIWWRLPNKLWSFGTSHKP